MALFSLCVRACCVERLGKPYLFCIELQFVIVPSEVELLGKYSDLPSAKEKNIAMQFVQLNALCTMRERERGSRSQALATPTYVESP